MFRVNAAPRVISCPLAAMALLCASQQVFAIESHICADTLSGTTPCELPATGFTTGTGTVTLPLSGNPGADVLIIDGGQTALLTAPDDYYNFGSIQNNGRFDIGSPAVTPWLRVMGPGSMLENTGEVNNLTIVYVQDNAILPVIAPSGSGSIYNHSGATFNNGSSVTDSGGNFLYGEIDAFDTAQVTNDGTFNNYSFYYMESTTTLVNNGEFTNFAPMGAFGADMLIEGTVTNTGTLRNVAGAAMEISGTLTNTASGRIVNDGKFESYAYGGGVGNLHNAGTVEITATATGSTPGFYAPGRFIQTAGSLSVDGEFVQSKFDIQGGIVTGGGTIDTTNSDVATGPTVYIGPDAILLPGNGSDNSLRIIGDVAIDGELVIEIAGTAQGTDYDFLRILADTGSGTSTGQLTLGEFSMLTVQLLDGFTPTVGDVFDIILADGDIIGSFQTQSTFDLAGRTFQWLTDGNGVKLSVIGNVPLPPALWLFASGLAAVWGLRRRRTPH